MGFPWQNLALFNWFSNQGAARRIVLFGLFVLMFWLVVGSNGESVWAQQRDIPDFLDDSGDTVSELQFESARVVRTDTHQVVVSWETNGVSYGRIHYGKKGSRMSNSRSLMNANTRHEVTLSELEEGTVYSFQIEAWYEGSGKRTTEPATVRTRGMPRPDFETVTVKNVTRSGGTVRWVTNVPTRSTFRAGHDSSDLRYTTIHDTPTRFHQVKLDHFYPDQPVFYQITLEDTRRRTTESGMRRFQTRENNVAYRRPVSGTFDGTHYGADDGFGEGDSLIQRVTDGDYSFMNGMATSGNPADTEQWFAVSFEELIVPDTIVIYWHGNARPGNYRIDGFKPTEGWTTLVEDAESASTRSLRKAGIKSEKHLFRLDGVETSIVRLRVRIPKGTSYSTPYSEWQYVQVQEMKVFPRTRGDEASDTMSELY